MQQMSPAPQRSPSSQIRPVQQVPPPVPQGPVPGGFVTSPSTRLIPASIPPPPPSSPGVVGFAAQATAKRESNAMIISARRSTRRW